MTKPKILFVYDLPEEHVWCDGLWAALNLLEADFEISYWNMGKDPKYPVYLLYTSNDDMFLLGWGAFGSKVDQFLQTHLPKHKKGLCIAGCANPPEGASNYDVLFYETKWFRPQIDFHPNIRHAFGINTDIFNETDLSFPVLFDYIGVGAMAKWKRWERMSAKPGRKLVCGYYQDDNEEESGAIVAQLLKHGVMVSNQVNPYDLALLYHCSRTAYIPAEIIGGGERSVLEARACGLNVEVEPDNEKLRELLEGPIFDHHYYAKQLKQGIASVL